MNTRRAILAAAGTLPTVSLRPAHAADYPGGPVRMVVPFAAGGNIDTIARLIQPIMSRRLGQPLVIENRAGGGGNVGTDTVAKARPDGLSVLLASNGPVTINPIIMARVPYDPDRDLAPIALVVRVPIVLMVSNKLPVKTLSEFIAYAKARPNQLTAGSPGTGTSNHLLIEMFNQATGGGLTHVPYRASGAALPDLMDGRLSCVFDQITTALPQHRDGQARIVALSPDRVPQLPEVPTFAEGGLTEITLSSYNGLFAPAGTPAEAVNALAAALGEALADQDLRGKIVGLGTLIATLEQATPAGFSALLKRESELSRRIALSANIRLD